MRLAGALIVLVLALFAGSLLSGYSVASASDSFSGFLEADTMTTFFSSSKLMAVKSMSSEVASSIASPAERSAGADRIKNNIISFKVFCKIFIPVVNGFISS